MACTMAEAYLSMAMPTNTNKSCTEIHTTFRGASSTRLDRHRTVKSLRTEWVVVMVIFLSVGVRSGGLPHPKTKSISKEPRTVKLTGRPNNMEFSPISAITRLHRQATPTSIIMAENSLRKGLNQLIESRSWPRRPSNSHNFKAYSTSSSISTRRPSNTLGRTIFRAANTQTLSLRRSTEQWCSSSMDTQLMYLRTSARLLTLL